MKLKLIKEKKYNIKNRYGGDRFMHIIIAISASISILMFLFGVLGLMKIIQLDEQIISGTDLMIFGVLSAIGPIGFYNHLKAKKKREIEEQLPDFLREISSSTSSGMTIFDSIKAAADGDHGRLTPELQMMSAQLSLGISIQDALNNFAKRINTDSVKRLAITINKALEIGGNTSTVFESAAREIDQIKNVEAQRRAEMSLYAIVIFISFFVFLAVILIIDKTIFQAIFDIKDEIASAEMVGGQTINFQNIDHNLLKLTFLSFVLVQSIGGGLLGGFMMDGKLSSGVRFGFILVLVTFFVFKFLF